MDSITDITYQATLSKLNLSLWTPELNIISLDSRKNIKSSRFQTIKEYFILKNLSFSGNRKG